MTERLYEDRADGSRAVSTKKEDPLLELALQEGVFFRFGESNELHCFYLLYFYYMPFPAKVKRCAESLQAPSVAAPALLRHIRASGRQ